MKKDDLTETMKKATSKVKELADSEAVKESKELLEEKAKLAAEKAKEFANSETVKETKEYIGEKAKVVSDKASEMISPEAREKAKQAAEGISQKANNVLGGDLTSKLKSRPVLIAIAAILAFVFIFSVFSKPKEYNSRDLAYELHKTAVDTWNLHTNKPIQEAKKYTVESIGEKLVKIHGKEIQVSNLTLDVDLRDIDMNPNESYKSFEEYRIYTARPGVQVKYLARFTGKDKDKLWNLYERGIRGNYTIKGVAKCRVNPVTNGTFNVYIGIDHAQVVGGQLDVQ